MSADFSRRIIKILRHNTEGLAMTSDGFVNVSELLQHLSSHFTEEDIKRMVKNDSKGRYALREYKNKLQIKATNGHSISLNVPMKETKHKFGLHGTFASKWEDIKIQGLSRKGRNHIHFASNDPSCRSGIPADRDIIIEVDIEKARKDGIQFLESENGVILSPGNSEGVIGKKYFAKVYHRSFILNELPLH